jgi:ABC-type dipeptide/oligopeptide/nickel transport system permease subunit
MATTTAARPGLKPTQEKPRTLWDDVWRRLRRDRFAVFGMIVAVVMYLTAILAPWLALYDFDTIDVYSRIVWGARSAAFVSISVTLLGLVMGLSMGVLAGYFGGWIDTVIMRIGDILFAFPGLLFVFFIAATIKPTLLSWVSDLGFSTLARSGYVDYLVVIIALGLVGWPGMARLIRGQYLSLKKREFILAAEAIGVPGWRIAVRHLLPNAMPPLIVAVSGGIGGIIMAESTLSFLGIGLQPPNPSWGGMLFEYSGYWRQSLWPLLFIPGVILVTIILAFNFLGDGLNDALNPHLD